MWYRIANIWRKELTDSTRDRKALTQALLIPVIVGVFYAVFNPLITSVLAERAKEPVKIPAQGIQYAGQPFLDTLKTFDITLEPFEGDLRAAIGSGEEKAGLIIPPGFSENVAREQPASLTLLTNRASGGIFGGSFSIERIDLAISEFNREVANNRVEARQIDPAVLTPINLDSQDLASPEQLAGIFASFTLPFILATIVAQGGMFIAIDVTAGEKERGTLESLLVTPASDFEVLTGKLAAVFTLTVVPLILTFFGFWGASNLLPESVTQGAVMPFNVVIGAIVVGLPLALFINVVLMIVSIRTKAFKDAQSAATPVMFAVMIPAFAAAFVPAASALAYLIPVYGSAAFVSSLATGSPMPDLALLFALLGSLAAAAVAFVVALKRFDREKLLYGT
jgi:sodium transport system permease protein